MFSLTWLAVLRSPPLSSSCSLWWKCLCSISESCYFCQRLHSLQRPLWSQLQRLLPAWWLTRRRKCVFKLPKRGQWVNAKQKPLMLWTKSSEFSTNLTIISHDKALQHERNKSQVRVRAGKLRCRQERLTNANTDRVPQQWGWPSMQNSSFYCFARKCTNNERGMGLWWQYREEEVDFSSSSFVTKSIVGNLTWRCCCYDNINTARNVLSPWLT